MELHRGDQPNLERNDNQFLVRLNKNYPGSTSSRNWRV